MKDMNLCLVLYCGARRPRDYGQCDVKDDERAFSKVLASCNLEKTVTS
jgi:hypothetical protein